MLQGLVQGLAASDSLLQTTTKAFTTTGTVATPIFRITGTVKILKLWGVVTVALGNHTAAYWRMNDQTAQANISVNTGTTLTNFVAGAFIARTGLAATALTGKDSAAGTVTDAASAGNDVFSPFVITKKTGANTDIEYVKTTSDDPTTGTIQFFVEYKPLSADGAVAAI